MGLLNTPQSSQPGVIKFAADLEKAAANLNIKKGLFVKALVVKLFGNIVRDTPVDTGRARASWNIGIGEPDPAVPADISETEKADREKRRRAGQQLGPSTQYAIPAAPNIEDIDGTQKVFITSNLVYMSALEHGHSKQRPHGMVGVNVAAMETSVQAAAAEVKGT